MKNLGANLFLFSVLLGIIFLPMLSLKAIKTEEKEVLSFEDIRKEYLEQRIKEQETKITELEKQLKQLQEENKSNQTQEDTVIDINETPEL